MEVKGREEVWRRPSGGSVRTGSGDKVRQSVRCEKRLNKKGGRAGAKTGEAGNKGCTAAARMEDESYLFVESQHVAHHLPGVRLLQDVAQQPSLRLKQVLKNCEKNCEAKSEQTQTSTH